jgi:hypothetical protein
MYWPAIFFRLILLSLYDGHINRVKNDILEYAENVPMDSWHHETMPQEVWEALPSGDKYVGTLCSVLSGFRRMRAV